MVERLPVWMVVGRAEQVTDRWVMAAGKEGHPQHFFEGVRAFGGNHHSVLMHAFTRSPGPQLRRGSPPPEGSEQHGVVFASMRGNVRMRADHLVKQRGARTGQAADEDRHAD